ncbi:hypothetical protein Tco_1304967 [Tanacetum coccineum]
MNYMQQPMQNPKDNSDPTTALDMALELMSKAFQLNNTTTTNNNQRMQNVGHLVRQNTVQNQDKVLQLQRIGSLCQQLYSKAKEKGCCLSSDTTTDCSKDEAGIQLNYEEFDFMAAAGAYDEIEKVTANRNLQDNLQQASTSGTQSDKLPSMIKMDQLRYTILKIVMIMIYSICLLKKSSTLNYSSPFLNHTKYNRMIVMSFLRFLVWNKVGEQ